MSKRFLLAITGCFLVPFLLAGCNGGEDFSDADIGGFIIQPSPGSGTPLGPDVDAVEIEFVDDRVLGLGYECRGTDERGTGYTGYIVAEDPQRHFEPNDGDNPVPEVVECGTDATAVDFFLGNAEGNAQDSERFALGTVYLPQQGKRQRYQVAPTDIITSPARLEVNDQTHDNGTDQQKRAFYMAALLQGLDNDGDADNGVIDIPYEAHERIMNCCEGVEGTPRSVEGFSGYNNYHPHFMDEWEPWFDDFNNTVTLPVDEEAVRTRLNQSLNRLRAGTYTIEGTLYEREIVEVEDADDIDNFLAPLVVQVPLLVYPDGVVQGLGYVARITGSFSDPDQSDTTLGAIAGGARLDARLGLVGNGNHGGWEMAGLFDENVELEFSGRFLGSNLYYDLDGPLTQRSDYKADFPQEGVYDTDDSDRGFYRGEALGADLRADGELLNGYKSGFVAADYDEDKLPGSTASGPKAPQFYELAPYKACSGDDEFDADCESFEDKDVSEPGNNYDYSDNTVADDDGENEVDVTQEQPKPATYPDANSPASDKVFNVEIRDGYVYTDLDRDCSATTADASKDSGFSDADGDEEHRVGFVTRTDDGGDDRDPSMNLIIHMTGPGLSEKIPHYGLRTSGRINLNDSEHPEYPFYRTGDDNFDQGIRARWVDRIGPSGFAYEQFRRSILESESDLDSSEERESITRVLGALEGREATSSNGACPP